MTQFNIIDIGSAGLLSEPWASHPATVGKVLKFEPRDADEAVPNVRFLPYALWSENTEREFYVYRGFNGTGSSLFHQNYHYVAAHFPELKLRGARRLAESWFERSGEIRRESLVCHTLDSVLSELRQGGDGQCYEFLKVDAQGADFEILKGAQEYLREDCLGLQCELFTLPLYEGITLLDDVEQWLDAKGYVLWRKHPAHGTFHSQHDCVFFRRDADTRELARVLDLRVSQLGFLPRLKRKLTRLAK